MKVGKRQLILASMILALGAAVYLNWTLSDGIPLKTTETGSVSSDALGEKLANAGLVSTVEANASAGGEETGTAEEDASVEAAKTLSEARVARQQSRDKAIEMLEEILEAADSSEEAKKEAISQAAEIAQNILKETNIENLLKAKGCNDCMIYLENGQCTVVVGNDFNEAEDLVIVRDIVSGQAGIGADAIKVVKAGT